MVSAAEFETGLPLKDTMLSRGIQVPVLVIVGSMDALNCGSQPGGTYYDCSSGAAIARQDAPYNSASAQLRACAIPGAGHDTSLAVNHRLQEMEVIAWSEEYVGQPGGATPSLALPGRCNSPA